MSVLFEFPQQAYFGKSIPKQKIYEHGSAGKRLKQLFVQQVDHILWAFKLAPETTNLPARGDVSEIQVLRIGLKTDELHPHVLRCIDEAIPFPTVFEVSKGQGLETRVRTVAAYKQTDTIRSDYFDSGWTPSGTNHRRLPTALNLEQLYAGILQGLCPVGMRPQENLADWMGRVVRIKTLERELAKVRNRLAKEKQFNRKMVIHAEIGRITIDLQALTD